MTIKSIRYLIFQLAAQGARVVFHHFGPAVNAPDPSPFSVKLETWLRVNNIKYVHDYEIVSEFLFLVVYKTTKIPHPRNIRLLFLQPVHPVTDKCPWATIDGTDIADSQLSIDKLAETFEVDLYENVTTTG